MKKLRFLALILLGLKWVQGQELLDFSQFYLPACCYVGPDIPTGYSELNQIRTPAKRETQEKMTAIESEAKHIISTNSTKNMTNTRQIYRLTVPIKFSDVMDYDVQESASSNDVQLTASARNETGNFSNSPHKVTKFSKKIGVISGASTSEEYAIWDPKRMAHKVRRKGIDSKINFTSPESAAQNSVEHVIRKIPSTWVKYLRRALYQSITNGEGFVDADISIQTHNRVRAEGLPKLKIRYPDTWRSIKTAQLQFVDKMSQVSTAPFGNIYLPLGEGPVTAGILVNSHDGTLHLRVASELQFPGQEILENCRCHLLGPGEIPLAYWSVGRIFKENGQPALQYLVYPLPHSVPTPPEMFPFAEGEMFLPSPIDPLINYYGLTGHPQIKNPSVKHKGHKNKNRNMKQIDGNNPSLVHPQFPHTFSPPFPSPTPMQLFNPDGIPPASGLNGQYNGQQFPPGFFEQYQIPLQNLFNQGIPTVDLNLQQNPNYINYNEGFQLPNPPPLQFPPPAPTTPTKTAIEPIDMGHVDGNILKNNPNFPNSIQDILSPQQEASPGPGPDLISSQPNPEALQPPPLPTPMGLQYPTPFPGTTPFTPPFIHPNAHFPPYAVGYQSYYPPGYLNYHTQILQNLIHNQIRQNSKTQTDGRQAAEKDKNGNSEITKQNLPDDYNRYRGKPEVSYKPYLISNLLDNERKYYPIRYSKASSTKYYDRYRPEKDRRFQKLQILSEHKNGAYILNF